MTLCRAIAVGLFASAAGCATPRPVVSTTPPPVVTPPPPAVAIPTPPAVVVPTPPVVTPTPRDLIVLAPHPDGAPLGVAVVTATGSSVDLATAGAAVTVESGRAPSAPSILSPDEIARLFGDALSSLPPPARRFVLYFALGNDTLTPESQTLVPAILALVAERGAPDVAILGHTDSTGAAAANVSLGLRRANRVRDRLVAAGLPGARIDVASRGESDPLEATPDNTGNARNRRVEVTVR